MTGSAPGEDGDPLDALQVGLEAGRRPRAGGSPKDHGALPATLTVIALALGVAIFGVETSRDVLARLVLGATALLATALAASANAAIRRRDELRGRSPSGGGADGIAS